MTEESIFTKIINRELPADIVHETDTVIAIRDINPQAPVHVLVIPKKPIRDVTEATAEDQAVLGDLFLVAAEVARKEGVDQSGYRIVVNNGPDSGQVVFHIHLHVMGGKKLPVELG